MIFMNIVDEVSKAIVDASTTLSNDRRKALENAISDESNENASWVLSQILENYRIANEMKLPLCDDTGIPHVIIEMGSQRQLSGEMITEIQKGISLGLENLPGRPMAVKGNDKQRLSQELGLYDKPSKMNPSPFLLDTGNDYSTYKREIDEDTLNIHLILEGGGPEIRSKTLRVFHKRSCRNVIDTAVGWIEESLLKLGCTPSIPSIGIGRTHYEAASLLLKSIAYGNLDVQSDMERYVTEQLNKSDIGPMGLGGKTTVLGSFVNIGNQRASGVRIVSIRPSCFVEPRVATVKV